MDYCVLFSPLNLQPPKIQKKKKKNLLTFRAESRGDETDVMVRLLMISLFSLFTDS